MQTGQIKMKAAILVLFSMIAYSYAQSCTGSCADGEACGWTCVDSSSTIPNAVVTGCINTNTSCSNSTGTQGTCEAACVTNLGGNGSSKLEFLTPLLVLGILAKLCFYP